MTRYRPEKPPPHTIAAEAAMRAETTTADAARRTAAFHVGAVDGTPEPGSEGPGIIKTKEPHGTCKPCAERAQGDSALVLTVSDRSAAGEREDRSGPLAAKLLAEHGLKTEVRVIPDGEASVRRALEEGIADGFRVIFTTGGTGVGPRDRTPEGTRPLLDLELPGLAQAMRDAGALAKKPILAAVLSRGLAGVALASANGEHGGTLIVNAPGSTGGVRDAVSVVGPLTAHILSQLDGGDH